MFGRANHNPFTRTQVLCRLMSSNGVEVRVGEPGCTPVTNGKTIVLPPIPLCADDLAVMLHEMAISHEPAHITEGSFDSTTTVKSRLHHHIWNVVEDVRVESLQEEHRYPGLKVFRSKFYRDFQKVANRLGLHKMTALDLSGALMGALTVLLLNARGKQLHEDVKVKTSKKVDEIYKRILADLVDEVAGVKTLKQSLDLAGVIYERVRNMLKEEAEEHQREKAAKEKAKQEKAEKEKQDKAKQDKAEDKDAEGDDSDGEDGDDEPKSKGSKSKKDEPEDSEDKDDEGSEGDDSEDKAGDTEDKAEGSEGDDSEGDKDGDAEGSEGNEPKDADKPEGSEDSEGDAEGSEGGDSEGSEDAEGDAEGAGGDANKDVPNSDEGGGKGAGGLTEEQQEAADDEAEKLLKAIEEEEAQTVSDQIKEEISEGKPAGKIPDYPKKVTVTAHPALGTAESAKLAEEGVKLLGAHGANMTRLMIANSRPRTLRNREHGKLDVRAVVSDDLDVRRDLWNQRRPGALAKAAVSILVDGSGSMTELGSLKAEYSAKVLHGIAHHLAAARVPFEAAYFDLDGLNAGGTIIFRKANYFTVKSWAEPWHGKAFTRVWPRGGGGTPLELAMTEQAMRLLERPEDKKIAIVLTDGRPDNGYGPSKMVVDAMRSVGVVVIGIGIECDVTSVFGKDAVNLDPANLGEHLVSKLTAILNEHAAERSETIARVR